MSSHALHSQRSHAGNLPYSRTFKSPLGHSRWAPQCGAHRHFPDIFSGRIDGHVQTLVQLSGHSVSSSMSQAVLLTVPA